MNEKKAPATPKPEGRRREEIVDKIIDWYDGLSPQQHAALQEFLAGSKLPTKVIKFPLPPYSEL